MKSGDLVLGKRCCEGWCTCIPECVSGKVGIVLVSWRDEDDTDSAVVLFENKEFVIRSANKKLEILSE